MELSSFNIKKVLMFSQKKAFLIFSKRERFSYVYRNGTMKFSVEGLKIKEIPPRKVSYILGNRNPGKPSYIFLKRYLFLCFGKPFIFQEVTTRAQK